ncbi:MAG TPA: hypothetical protein VFS42_04260, partial [Burkholderiaceae bacterium]|nr:hypothetical protein [Burkholderiaceae bacterium]
DFMARVPGLPGEGGRLQTYPSTVAYLATLILHRYRTLGILDANGQPMNAMGIVAIDQVRPLEPATLRGKVCPECGNPTIIKKDGCEYCTSCGHIGACG